MKMLFWKPKMRSYPPLKLLFLLRRATLELSKPPKNHPNSLQGKKDKYDRHRKRQRSRRSAAKNASGSGGSKSSDSIGKRRKVSLRTQENQLASDEKSQSIKDSVRQLSFDLDNTPRRSVESTGTPSVSNNSDTQWRSMDSNGTPGVLETTQAPETPSTSRQAHASEEQSNAGEILPVKEKAASLNDLRQIIQARVSPNSNGRNARWNQYQPPRMGNNEFGFNNNGRWKMAMGNRGSFQGFRGGQRQGIGGHYRTTVQDRLHNNRAFSTGANFGAQGSRGGRGGGNKGSLSNSVQNQHNLNKNKSNFGSNTTQNQIVKPKKPKQTYSDAVKSDLAIIIRKADGSLLTDQEYETLRRFVIKEQEETADDYPIFDGVHIHDGCAKFNCADEFTSNWIKLLVSKISSTLNIGELISLSAKEHFNLRKAVIILPWDPQEPQEPEKIFLNLKRANRGLDTKLWLIKKQIESEDNQNRRIFSLRIDEASAEFIEKRGNKLHYLLNVVSVKLSKPNSGNGDEVVN